MKNKNPLVEVMVMNCNNRDLVDKCLKSLKKTTYSNLKISVIDNGSNDGSVEMIRKRYPWVNLEANEENLGFAVGYNRVLKKSKAKYAILLNEDTEQDPEWVSEMIKIAEKNKDIAAMQPKVKDLKNKKMFEYAGAAGGYMDIYGYPICRGRIFDDVEQDEGQYDNIRETFWSCGVAMLINLEVLRKIGYMDETIHAYAEEIDLAWRMNLAGYRQIYSPKSVIYHLGSASWNKKGKQFRKNYLIHRNHFIILFKNFSKKTWFRIVPVKFMLEAIAFFGFLFKEPFRAAAILKANLWILTHIPTLVRKNYDISRIKKINDSKIMDKMIKRSLAFDHFVLRNKKNFNHYVKYIKDFK